ncbi:MAG: 16S rRNA (cytidine(1402)-2'-O)-methyltransferase [Caldiserica bacterium CG02_land_8_20_14_3_00_36_38]|jgi:16S rRNA (cytidine1402-2'-O)-methyltransferase|nr:16S rRNA (cytidine(1402)-2'-O)-methyltransferase [Caldisericota bacterium]OIP12540.1 MAG: 16S rRNA (cytidine(1402)-2'-O)-methyltransferase [Caldisericum sp. CG2_30_36_11]PIP49676.1 MAG: 16S rRNA (cytidine(1402)-2'-O)-methyltransferase [Caldiserica bacterium CG23_combo_of_CG06-09_8_20_14_all_35_60]PIV56280.1 MAG: 16S rRNA (cytidine(1402)-2'-O)-methyltransferase [Caldiserica bacterium CG02_land_8_20_14_3_00_36_38]PIX28333.1 MAG: 16S rRNA (cytidine(1402)-2'-O)-methyltransferase [Caldiserica bac
MTLYVCPTPIGNLKDVTLRVLEILKSVDAILAEDTRKTRIILNEYSIKTSLISFHSYTSEDKLKKIVEGLLRGKNFALVSEAGTPGISDPGFKLIKTSIDKGVHLEVLPGATSFLPALLLSGLPPDHFIFYGFLPRKKGKRIKILQSFKDFRGPVIYFESPYRVKEFLNEFIEGVGDRYIALVREISKIHEEVLRGKASEILEAIKDREIKGEVVIVVGNI